MIKVLAAEQRSLKKGSGWYIGSTAKSHSTSTQYRHTIPPATQAKRKGKHNMLILANVLKSLYPHLSLHLPFPPPPLITFPCRTHSSNLPVIITKLLFPIREVKTRWMLNSTGSYKFAPNRLPVLNKSLQKRRVAGLLAK